jgi:hypothetical protein
MNVEADGRADRSRGANVADAEEDRILLEVGATKYTQRTTEIEKRDARRKDDDDGNFTPGGRKR